MVRGATRVRPAPEAGLNVRAVASPVTAASTPIEVPYGSRPVSLAAPRIVAARG